MNNSAIVLSAFRAFYFRCFVLTMLILMPAVAAGAVLPAVWDGGTGTWSDSSHWSTNPIFPNNSDVTTYQASMSGGSLTLDRPITVDSFAISGGTFIAANDLNLPVRFEATGGTATFAPGASLSTSLLKISAGAVNFNYDLVLPPTQLSGGVLGGTLGGSGNLTVMDGFDWSGGMMAGTGTTTFVGNHTVSSTPDTPRAARAIINTGGTLDWRASGGNAYIVFLNGGSFTNSADAIFLIHGSLSSYSQGHTTQEFIHNAGVFRQDAADSILSNIYLPFRNSGVVESLAGTLQFGGGYRQTAGITKLKGISFNSNTGGRNVIFDGGSVIGSTNIDAPTLTAAIMSIGDPFGEIRVTDSLTLLNGSRVMFDIGGLTRISKYDSLYAETLDLGGTLDIRLANGFESSIRTSDTFNIITTSRSRPIGSFTNLDDGRIFTSDGLGSFRVTINSTGVILDDFRAVPEPISGFLIGAAAVIFLTRRRFNRPLGLHSPLP
jgi:hypothetical protein